MGQAIADRIDGEWRQIETPIVSSNGGHGMFFEKDGKLFMSYHMPNDPHMLERAYFVEIEEVDGLFRIKQDPQSEVKQN